MKNSAPIAGPQKLTRPPPIRTIMTTKPDECRLMTLGYADCCASANIAPARPANADAIVITSHL